MLDDPGQLGRKNAAFNLTRPGGRLYQRVLFLDADVLLLDHDRSRAALADVWALPKGHRGTKGRIYAMPAGNGADCFNTGLMLLQPNRTDFKLLQRAVWDPSAVTLAHCASAASPNYSRSSRKSIPPPRRSSQSILARRGINHRAISAASRPILAHS